eukprot:4495468-Pleurochrysis_carterae.AAC.2
MSEEVVERNFATETAERERGVCRSANVWLGRIGGQAVGSRSERRDFASGMMKFLLPLGSNHT